MLLRAATAVLKLLQPQIIKCKTQEELFTLLKSKSTLTLEKGIKRYVFILLFFVLSLSLSVCLCVMARKRATECGGMAIKKKGKTGEEGGASRMCTRRVHGVYGEDTD